MESNRIRITVEEAKRLSRYAIKQQENKLREFIDVEIRKCAENGGTSITIDNDFFGWTIEWELASAGFSVEHIYGEKYKISWEQAH